MRRRDFLKGLAAIPVVLLLPAVASAAVEPEAEDYTFQYRVNGGHWIPMPSEPIICDDPRNVSVTCVFDPKINVGDDLDLRWTRSCPL